jgi:hypothetical protein
MTCVVVTRRRRASPVVYDWQLQPSSGLPVPLRSPALCPLTVRTQAWIRELPVDRSQQEQKRRHGVVTREKRGEAQRLTSTPRTAGLHLPHVDERAGRP